MIAVATASARAAYYAATACDAAYSESFTKYIRWLIEELYEYEETKELLKNEL